MVDGKVGFHCPQLMVLERGPHAFGLLCRSVGLLVPVQVIGVVLVTTWEGRGQSTGGRRGDQKGTTARNLGLVLLDLFSPRSIIFLTEVMVIMQLVTPPPSR